MEPILTLSYDYKGWYTALAWLYHLLTLVIIFSPLFFVARKWKPAKWKDVIGATILSFLIFLLFYWVIDTSISYYEKWVWSVRHYDLFLDPFNDIWFLKGAFLSTLLFTLSPFYSVRLIYGPYNWRRFFIALGFAFVMLFLIIAYQAFVFIRGLAAFFYQLN